MKKLTVILLVVIMAISMVACDQTEPEVSDEPSTEVEETAEMTEEEPEEEMMEEEESMAKAGGTLILRMQGDPESYDIVQNRVMNFPAMVYETILAKDENGDYIGVLVESFEADIDAMTYTFHMRDQEILFHDGSVLTSEVFVWNINQYKEVGFFASSLNKVDRAEVVDDKTFVIHMAEWDMLIPNNLTRMVDIVSKEYVENNGGSFETALARNASGTGPFMISEVVDGEKISLVKFVDYWQGEPLLDGIDAVVYGAPEVAALAVETGDIDILNTFGITMDSIMQMASQESVTLYTAPRGGTAYTLGFHCLNPEEPLSDVNVRKAIAYAINEKQIIEVLAGEYVIEGSAQWAAPGDPYYSPNVPGFPYDLEKAKEMLDASGYADGFDTTLKVRIDFEEVAVLIAGSLAEIGITCEIELLDTATFGQYIRGWDSGMFIHTVGIANGQEYQLTNSARSDVVTGYGSNSFIHTDEIDALCTAALTTTVEDSYQYIHQVAEAMFMENVSMYVLGLSEGLVLAQADLMDAGIAMYGNTDVASYHTAWIDD